MLGPDRLVLGNASKAQGDIDSPGKDPGTHPASPDTPSSLASSPNKKHELENPSVVEPQPKRRLLFQVDGAEAPSRRPISFTLLKIDAHTGGGLGQGVEAAGGVFARPPISDAAGDPLSPPITSLRLWKTVDQGTRGERAGVTSSDPVVARLDAAVGVDTGLVVAGGEAGFCGSGKSGEPGGSSEENPLTMCGDRPYSEWKGRWGRFLYSLFSSARQASHRTI